MALFGQEITFILFDFDFKTFQFSFPEDIHSLSIFSSTFLTMVVTVQRVYEQCVRRLGHRARWQGEEDRERGIEQLRFYSQLSPGSQALHHTQAGKAGPS